MGAKLDGMTATWKLTTNRISTHKAYKRDGMRYFPRRST